MRQPHELNEHELALIAHKVRTRLITKFGSTRTAAFMFANADIVTECMRETFLAVREKLERER